MVTCDHNPACDAPVQRKRALERLRDRRVRGLLERLTDHRVQPFLERLTDRRVLQRSPLPRAEKNQDPAFYFYIVTEVCEKNPNYTILMSTKTLSASCGRK